MRCSTSLCSPSFIVNKNVSLPFLLLSETVVKNCQYHLGVSLGLPLAVDGVGVVRMREVGVGRVPLGGGVQALGQGVQPARGAEGDVTGEDQGGLGLEIQTMVHPKVRNHGEGRL